MCRLPALVLPLLLLASVRASGADLVVRDGWIRYLPAGVPAAGYFTLVNRSGHPVDFVAAESPTFARIMLHETIETNAVAQMVEVQSVPVAAGATLRFAPGGYHLMLMGRKQPLRVGQQIRITLRFRGGESAAAMFRVHPASASSP